MTNLIKRHWGILLVVLINVVAHSVWIFSTGTLTYSDTGIWLPATQRELLQNSLSVYNGNIDLGGAVLTGGYALIELIYGALAVLHINYDIAFRILLLWPYVFVTPVAAYLLGRKILKSESAAAVSALVVCFNTYSLTTQGGQLLIMFGDMLALLFLYFFYCFYLESRRRSLFFGMVLTGMLLSAYEFRIFYMTVLLATIFLIYKSLFIKRSFKDWLSWGLFGTLMLLLNTYWLLPTIKSGSLVQNTLFSRGLFGDQYFDASAAMTLFHRFWTGGATAIFQVQPIPLFFWIIPILAVLGFVLNRKNRIIVFFGIVSIVGIVLAKQSAEPFPGLYQWLYDHLPGFNAFREASKFYLIVVLGYSILIGALVGWLRHHAGKNRLYALGSYLVVALVATLFVYNLKPLVTNSFGTMFVTRHIPSDYTKFNQFVEQQPGYFRTYWVPRDSRWALYTNNHPKIVGADMLQNGWQQFTSPQANLETVGRHELDQLSQPYASQLLSVASVKYVVVPLEDSANDDDFFKSYGEDRQTYIKTLDHLSYLKRVNLGTRDLAVYETTSYQPLLTAQSDLVQIDSYDNLGLKAAFLKSVGHNDLNLTTATIPGAAFLKDLFVSMNATTQSNFLTISDSLQGVSGWLPVLYKNDSSLDIKYRATNSSVQVYSQPVPNPSINGTAVPFPGADSKTVLANAPLSNDSYLILDNQIVSILQGTHNLGGVRQYSHAGVYTAGANRITNGSFENGGWHPKVSDCNNYDQNPQIGMRLDPADHTSGRQSLELEATRHKACTYTQFAVQPGSTNVFSFDYQSPNSKQAGYYLVFNDPAHTVVQDQLSINQPKQWQRVQKIVTVPGQASAANLVIYAYESDGHATNTVRYDNFSFGQPRLISQVNLPNSQDSFLSQQVHLRTGSNTISITSNEFGTTNLISDPSFEDGPWAPAVGDCGASDQNPEISQKIITQDHTDGKQALELSATRHIACTSTNFGLNETGDHLLSFDFHGYGKEGGYNLQFNDPAKTVFSGYLELKPGNSWQHFQRTITVPVGADSGTLIIYAYSSDGRTANIVRYDNFRMIKIPNVSDTYYMYSGLSHALQVPGGFDFEQPSPTKLVVSLHQVTKPFVLSFGEAFDSGWKLYPQTNGQNLSDYDLVKQSSVFDDKHFTLAGFSNGWFINPAYIKSHFSKDYYHTNPDGSINLNLVMYYKPQSYFYIGSWVSGLTLVGCIVYLGFGWLRRRGNQNRRRKVVKKSASETNEMVK